MFYLWKSWYKSYSTERLLKRSGECIRSSTLPKPSKRTSSLRVKTQQPVDSSSCSTGGDTLSKERLKPVSASHENVLESGASGRIVARLTECPNASNSHTSVATVEEYRKMSASSPVKPVRNRRKSGASSKSNSESIPLLVQSRALVHQQHHDQTNHVGATNHSPNSAPKGNVDEVEIDPPTHRVAQMLDELPRRVLPDELHANIAPPAYSAKSESQFLSPSALFKSSNCVNQRTRAHSDRDPAPGHSGKAGQAANPSATPARNNTSNALNRYDFIQCTKLWFAPLCTCQFVK